LNRPLERLKLKQLGPWGARLRGRSEFQRAGGTLGRGRFGGGLGAHISPAGGRSWGGAALASRSSGVVARRPLELHSGEGGGVDSATNGTIRELGW
jgi:hypothetical protein